jgi:hypothetical protein
MPTQPNIFDESPAVDGPDYVALVIEWDELADELEREIAGVRPEPIMQKPNWRHIGLAAGVLGAVAVTLGVLGARLVRKLRA